MTTLDHCAAAELLFATGQTPATTQDAVAAIAREYRLHPDLAHAAAVMAAEYGEHWEIAAARMTRCLLLVPDRVEVPDALSAGPERPGGWRKAADHRLADTMGEDQ